MKKIEKIAILIPAYLEEKAIANTVQRTSRYCQTVIVIDDGSTDLTAEQARSAGAQMLIHNLNQGKGNAIKTGFSEALRIGLDAVIILDGDGQHDPVEIPAFIKIAEEKEADLVIGNRMGNPEGMPLIRYITNKVTSFLLSCVAGSTIKDSQCGYRLIRTWLIPQMNLTTARYDTESEMLLEAARLGARIENVPVKSLYFGSVSHIRKVRDTIRFFRLLFRYSMAKKNKRNVL